MTTSARFVQNHLLELLALLTMDPPAGYDVDARRNEKYRAFRAMRPLSPAEVVRGQYRGYRREQGVDPESNTETFAALRVHVDSWRWSGVPFYIRAGKCLPVTATEIRVELKPPPKEVFDRLPPIPNYARFRLSPDVAISLGAVPLLLAAVVAFREAGGVWHLPRPRPRG